MSTRKNVVPQQTQGQDKNSLDSASADHSPFHTRTMWSASHSVASTNNEPAAQLTA